MGQLKKTDFEKIAAIFKARRDLHLNNNPNKVTMCDLLARDLCDYLATTNGQFKRDEFLRLCGVEVEEW